MPPGWDVADAKSDILTGKLILAAAFIAAVVIIVVPYREGASPGGKFILVGLALSAAGKGLQMVSNAKRRLGNALSEKKEPNQSPEPSRL
jgi:ABC-type Fe3+-siderophore transport system permease subunit